MGRTTGIEWTDATWNPIRGCSRVSEGCRNCYAESTAYRFSGAGQPYEGLAVLANGHASWTGKVEFVEKHLLDPLKWKAPRRIFVNSMSDLFHEGVTDEMRDRIFAVMALCPQHTFQVLTKRPERMRAYLDPACGRIADRIIALRRQRGDNGCVCPLPHVAPGAAWWPLANVWLGVSVENQAAADERIPLLLETPAAARFISAEPLLGPVNLEELPSASGIGRHLCALSNAGVDPGALFATKLDWVICGGESGPGARPMHPDWARSLRDQCAAAADVPFFFKQWGEWAEVDGGPPNRVFDVDRHHAPIDRTNCVIALDGHTPSTERELRDNVKYRWMSRVGKKAAGSLLDGAGHKAFPGAK
jgi:protein gp37